MFLKTEHTSVPFHRLGEKILKEIKSRIHETKKFTKNFKIWECVFSYTSYVTVFIHSYSKGKGTPRAEHSWQEERSLPKTCPLVMRLGEHATKSQSSMAVASSCWPACLFSTLRISDYQGSSVLTGFFYHYMTELNHRSPWGAFCTSRSKKATKWSVPPLDHAMLSSP